MFSNRVTLGKFRVRRFSTYPSRIPTHTTKLEAGYSNRPIVRGGPRAYSQSGCGGSPSLTLHSRVERKLSIQDEGETA
jgi:hypothetical protein